MRIDYSVENDNLEDEFTSIRSLAVGLRNGQIAGTCTVGSPDRSIPLAEGERVLQREDFEWVKNPAIPRESARWPRPPRRRPLGGHAAPVATVAGVGGNPRPTPVLRGLPSLAGGLLREAARRGQAVLPDPRRTAPSGRVFKTWEFWICRGDATASSRHRRRPVASVPPEWIEGSRALGAGRGRPRPVPRLRQALAAGIDRFQESRDRAREYGMMNFGDWHGELAVELGNLEYDPARPRLPDPVRPGENPAFFRRRRGGPPPARRRHPPAPPTRGASASSGRIPSACAGYPGDYKDMKVYASPGWSDNRGHVWSQGMFEHYLLGGDRRSYDTARMISDVYGGPG